MTTETIQRRAEELANIVNDTVYPRGKSKEDKLKEAAAIIAQALTEAEERGRVAGLEEAANLMKDTYDAGHVYAKRICALKQPEKAGE